MILSLPVIPAKAGTPRRPVTRLIQDSVAALRWAALTILALLLTACSPEVTQAPAEDAQTQIHSVILIRHAEKQKGNDPGLTEAGQKRALFIRDEMGKAGFDFVHSTDYRRTRATAQPLADALGQTILIYDPRDLPAMADKIRSMPGTHLVVGHSNTTPDLAALLSGDPVIPMSEQEYDRMYHITLGAYGKAVETIIATYGD